MSDRACLLLLWAVVLSLVVLWYVTGRAAVHERARMHKRIDRQIHFEKEYRKVEALSERLEKNREKRQKDPLSIVQSLAAQRPDWCSIASVSLHEEQADGYRRSVACIEAQVLPEYLGAVIAELEGCGRDIYISSAAAKVAGGRIECSLTVVEVKVQ